jgi:hypothetical protein
MSTYKISKSNNILYTLGNMQYMFTDRKQQYVHIMKHAVHVYLIDICACHFFVFALCVVTTK